MRALIFIFAALTTALQPRAPELSGQFHGVVSAQGQGGALNLAPALAEAERRDVMRLSDAENPAVYQSSQTVRVVNYDLTTPAGARIGAICAGPCRVTGVIGWREPNDWWFTEVSTVERLAMDYDFGALSVRAAPGPVGRTRATELAAGDALHETLVQTLQAAMEVEIGQPLRFQALAVRRQSGFAYVVVQPAARDGGEVDFEATRWREQWRYGPWDGGIIHALFRDEGERWSLATFIISPVTDTVIDAWVADYRAPAELFNVDARRLEAAAAR